MTIFPLGRYVLMFFSSRSLCTYVLFLSVTMHLCSFPLGRYALMFFSSRSLCSYVLFLSVTMHLCSFPLGRYALMFFSSRSLCSYVLFLSVTMRLCSFPLGHYALMFFSSRSLCSYVLFLSVAMCLCSFPLASTDDEDGMDCMDNERRPHFPQFSYSASGREWVPYCGASPHSSYMVTTVTTGPSAPNQPLSIALSLSPPPSSHLSSFTHWVDLESWPSLAVCFGYKSGLQDSTVSLPLLVALVDW